jgi:hypothetical protein
MRRRYLDRHDEVRLEREHARNAPLPLQEHREVLLLLLALPQPAFEVKGVYGSRVKDVGFRV